MGMQTLARQSYQIFRMGIIHKDLYFVSSVCWQPFGFQELALVGPLMTEPPIKIIGMLVGSFKGVCAKVFRAIYLQVRSCVVGAPFHLCRPCVRIHFWSAAP